mgnify:CR=1 FL=1
MFTLDSNLSSYVSTQINGIASALEYEASKIPETYLANDYLREATWLKSKSDQISKGEESLLYFPDYIAVFRTFCTVLSKYSRTYRFMMWICEHTAWINTSSSRYDLITLLKDISEDWDWRTQPNLLAILGNNYPLAPRKRPTRGRGSPEGASPCWQGIHPVRVWYTLYTT